MRVAYLSEYQPVMRRMAFLLKTVLLVAGLIFLVKSYLMQSVSDRLLSLFFAVTLISILVYMLVVIPQAICLGEKQLIIKRAFGRKSIPYSSIKKVIPYNEVQSDIRYFGSNGFLGYIGIMGSTQYGRYYSYVKNAKQQVFILTENKNYLLSCGDSDMFIKDLSQRISQGAYSA